MVFFKRTKAPKIDASVSVEDNFSSKGRLSVLSLSVESGDLTIQEQLVEFIQQAAIATNARFAYVHMANVAESLLAAKTGTFLKYHRGSKYGAIAVFSPQLQKGFPNLYWLTILGQPYVDMIGRQTINSCPVYKISWLSSDMVAIQLSEKISDSIEKEEKFENTRALVKKAIGPSYFQSI